MENGIMALPLWSYSSTAFVLPGYIHALETFIFVVFYIAALAFIVALYKWTRSSHDKSTLRYVNNMRQNQQRKEEYERKQREAREQRQRENTFYVTPDGKAQKGTERQI